MPMASTTGKKLPGYETTFVTRVDLSDDALKTFKERIISIMKTFDGEIVYQEDWGKRKFAYPIQKEVRGHYTHIVYTGHGDVVAEVERNLRLNENVLRFMTVNLAKEFNHEVFTKELGGGTPLKREDRPAGEGITPNAMPTPNAAPAATSAEA
jgi:small subunit ribosomal protein S6